MQSAITRMTKTVKLNYKNDPVNKNSLWKCNDCSSIDSKDYILWCPAFSNPCPFDLQFQIHVVGLAVREENNSIL